MKIDVWLITGSQRKGKTTLILAIKGYLQTRNIPICGVVSPGVYIHNQRIKIIAQNVENEEQHELAQYSPGWDTTMPEKIWKMDSDGVLWGNIQLENCEPYGKIFILDEIGIYELLEKNGWQAGLDILIKKQYRKAIVTVRKEFYPSLIKICEKEHISYELIDLDQEERTTQDIIEKILSSLSEKL